VTNEEALQLESGIYRITWTDAHVASIGIVSGPAGFTNDHGERPLATMDARCVIRASNVMDMWRLVDHVERLAVCETSHQCTTRRELTKLSAYNAIALKDSMSGSVAEIARDSFLAGNDAEALAIISTELGFVPLASPRPVWRDLKIGDPVVVVAYGRIVNASNSHGACLEVSLFSNTLGYRHDASRHTLWVEPDELRYSLPPKHIDDRLTAADRVAIGEAARDLPTGKLTEPENEEG